MLLSGGEKALTALALLIAIFRYQPSPFCILDEVDALASTRETNVGRFAKMVAEMSADAQFIVVTHNRRTMEMAQVLYGVTMQEPGVSKLVSVSWEQTRAAAAKQRGLIPRAALAWVGCLGVFDGGTRCSASTCRRLPEDCGASQDTLSLAPQISSFHFCSPLTRALSALQYAHFRGLNRPVATPKMSAVVWETNFPGLKLLSRGKVRVPPL